MIGTLINNYRIVSRLGEGGMGAVYLAEHSFTGRKAAIKILHPDHCNDSVLVNRFMNEARATNIVQHPSIVDIIDVGFLPGQRIPFLLMEYLEGETLADRLKRGPLPVETAAEIALQTASGVAAAHAKGIVHRDLKPANLLLVASQPTLRVKVLDFGIAKLRPGLGGDTHRTGTGIVMGTPQYMAPEQCRGVSQQIDERTDVYALGVILYEMLCGRAPFVSIEAAEIWVMHLRMAPESPRTLNPELPEAIEALVLRALEKQPENRFQSMGDFFAALAPFAPPHEGLTPEPVRLSMTDRRAQDGAVANPPGGGPMAAGVPAGAAAVANTFVAADVGRATRPSRRRSMLTAVGATAVAGVGLFAFLSRRVPAPSGGTGPTVGSGISPSIGPEPPANQAPKPQPTSMAAPKASDVLKDAPPNTDPPDAVPVAGAVATPDPASRPSRSKRSRTTRRPTRGKSTGKPASAEPATGPGVTSPPRRNVLDQFDKLVGRPATGGKP